MGQRIAFHRKRCGLTQEQLAEKCGVTPQAVSKWENDLTAPDIGLLPVLSGIFGVTCDDLLGVRRAEASAEQTYADPSKMLLKIKVNGYGNKVDINVPLLLAEEFCKSGIVAGGANGALKDVDLAQLLLLARQGAVGKLLEVQSEEGDTVEIWVE